MPDEPEISPVIVASVALSTTKKGVERKDPKLAVLALEMMCQGWGHREITEQTGIPFDNLLTLRARHEMAIDTRRKQLAGDGFEMAEGLRLLAKQKMEMLANDPDALAKVNIRDLAISYGVAVDKGMLALDGNRTIVEHVSRKPSLEDAQAAIDEARAALQKEAIPI